MVAAGSVLDISNAKGALTGARYIESLRDGREVWLNGKRVEDVTKHPAFAGIIETYARIYDLQHSAEFGDQMTFVSPNTGNRVSNSYRLPRSREDLEARWRNTEIWMEQSWGQLGRTPDFMAAWTVAYYGIRDDLAKVDPRFGENAVNYHRFAMEHDLALTHAIGDPQINRADVFTGPDTEPDMALRVVKETPKGVIVRGAKQLATFAPVANENLIALSATFSRRPRDEFVQWFAIPVNTPGYKIVCRDPVSLPASGHAHPFGSLYDEQDAMCFFDDVLVPWERIFMLYDRQAAVQLFQRMGREGLGASLSTDIRYYNRILTYVAVTCAIAEAIGVDTFREVRDKLGELISYAEVIRLGIEGSKADAYHTPGGLMGTSGFYGFGIFEAQISTRIGEILRQVGASGLLMQPSEADLTTPELRPYLERYMHGADISVDEKSRLFRLGWDLSISSFGMRQELYEYWHRGDIVRNRTNLYLGYDRSHVVNKIRRLISDGASDSAITDGQQAGSQAPLVHDQP